MHSRVKEVKDMYIRVENMHRIVYGLLVQVRDDLKGPIPQGDRVDLSYLLNQIAKMLKDIEKESRLLREQNDNIVCFKAMTEGSVEKIKGEVATGTPDVKMTAKLPRKDSEEFLALMEDLGISHEVVGLDAVRPHYPGLVELISQRVAAGGNPPKGVDVNTMHPKYSLILRKQSGVDL